MLPALTSQRMLPCRPAFQPPLGTHLWLHPNIYLPKNAPYDRSLSFVIASMVLLLLCACSCLLAILGSIVVAMSSWAPPIPIILLKDATSCIADYCSSEYAASLVPGCCRGVLGLCALCICLVEHDALHLLQFAWLHCTCCNTPGCAAVLHAAHRPADIADHCCTSQLHC